MMRAQTALRTETGTNQAAEHGISVMKTATEAFEEGRLVEEGDREIHGVEVVVDESVHEILVWKFERRIWVV